MRTIFEREAEKYNMTISVDKTKSMVIAKEPQRCKLMVNNKAIEQVMTFTYLGVEISSYGNLTKEITSQTIKANSVAGCLKDVILRNEFLNIDSKVRIYKSCIRPIMTYAVETRADTSKTKHLLRKTEMRVLRTITGKTLRDRIRSETIRETCKVQDIVRWTRQRRRDWNEHVSRMDNNRIARMARDGKVGGRRLPGRPLKRWKESWQSTSQE